MLDRIGQLLLWLRGGSLKLLTTAALVLLVWGTLSPVGTLIWWLSEGAESLGLKGLQLGRSRAPSADEPSPTVSPESANGSIDCYVIFLAGVGDFSADQITPGEEFFLKQLVQEYPNCVAVADVFPYSAANEGLGGRRLLAPMWRFAEKADGFLSVANVVIKIRNLWRFAISADDRYGSIYNQGISSAIIDRMNAAHPIPTASPQPLQIILVGTSGGAQVALGAAPYLEQWLSAEISVISIGGVFAGDNGFDSTAHVYHLEGRQDWIEDIGKIFPSRWIWAVSSPFNRAWQRGDYSVHVTGVHEHDGDRGYFGQAIAQPDGTTYVELTLESVEQLPLWTEQP